MNGGLSSRVRDVWGVLASGLLTCAAVSGCAGSGDGLDGNGRPVGESGGGGGGGGGGSATFQQIQDQIFTPICTACHAGGSAPLGLRLDAGNSYALLVNTPSVEVSSLLRVEPGDPDSSYIVQKVEGRAAVGGRMPLGGPALSQANIDLIKQWIAEGAPGPTGAATSATAMATLADAAVSSTLRVTSTVPADGELTNGAIDAVMVILNRDIDPSLVSAATVSLVASDSNGRFDSADAQAVPLASARVSPGNAALIVLKPSVPLTAGSYEVVLKGSGATALASTDGRVLDGNGDGQPGGDFKMSFDIGTGVAP